MRKAAVFFLLGLVGGPGSLNAQPDLMLQMRVSALRAQSDLAVRMEVRSAKRADRYVDPVSRSEVTAPSPQDVVLIVEVSGISDEQFASTPKNDIVISAGSRRWQPTVMVVADRKKTERAVSRTGTVEEDHRIVVIVPRDVTDFSLRFGTRPPLAFKAESPVVRSLP